MDIDRRGLIKGGVALGLGAALLGGKSWGSAFLEPSELAYAAGAPVGASGVSAASATSLIAKYKVKNWSNEHLAAQLLMISVGSAAKTKTKSYIRSDLGGILLQAPVPSNIASLIKAGNQGNNKGIKAFVASDEEGGAVQRFRKLIGSLPSAATMGTYPNSKITKLTSAYAKKLHKFGVNVTFGPVAGYKVKGNYLTNDKRCFANTAAKIWSKTNAWAKGFESQKVLACYKHWPGEGHAGNTHTASSKVPKLAYLEKHDMLPFNQKFKQGCDMVMIGHVIIPGLSEGKAPASLSTNCYKYLRKKCGDRTVIITDSLSMKAATNAAWGSVTKAIVYSLRRGADLALIDSGTSPAKAIAAVATAIKQGTIKRSAAIAKVGRILAVKHRYGLA